MTLRTHTFARLGVLFACWLLGLVLAIPPSQARDVGEFGGYDGNMFREPCRSGDVLIGLSMMTGKALDRVNPICIDITPQRTWTGEAYEGNWAGGSGGGYQKIACEPGHAVTHITVWQDHNGAINHVALICQDLNSDYWYDVLPQQVGGEAISDQQLSCGPGEYGSGIYGKAHDLVTSLGFMCEEVAAAPAPVASAADTKAYADQRAYEMQVTGKTAAECQNSNQMCEARIKASFEPSSALAMIVSDCAPYLQMCVANAAAAAAKPKPEPAQGGVAIIKKVTGYDAPDGNDRCYLDPGETAKLLGVDPDDSIWKHLQGIGACDGQDFWVYDQGELRAL
jgi:hypothetical protein